MVTATSQRRFRPRFRLRTFLVVVTIFCVWLGWHIHETRRQREAVEAIRACGGEVLYDYQVKDHEPVMNAQSWAPEFARELIGDDVFHTVVQVRFPGDASRRTGRDIHSTPILQIATLRRLTHLDMHDYAVDDEDLLQLSRLTELVQLTIMHADGVTDEGVAHLSSLRKLRLLSLQYSPLCDPALTCQLGDRSLEVISQMPELVALDIWGTFTNEGVGHLSRLKQLRALHFGHDDVQHKNEITDQSLAFLLDQPNIHVLVLSHTKVTREFVGKVKTKFPQARVSW